ncbi:hypothetical protein [Alkaliphilus crotonatoxidans]
MKKTNKASISILTVILLLVSILPTFASNDNLETYSYSIAGDKGIIRVVVDNGNEKVVERTTADGRIIVTIFDKINNKLIREEKANGIFRKITNSRIEIDLSTIEDNSNIITPTSIEEEFEETFRSSIFGTYIFKRRDVVTSSNHLVYLDLSIKNDSLYSGGLLYSNSSDRYIINKGEDFKYNVKNADTFGTNFNFDLSEAMTLAGTTKSLSAIQSFVALTSVGLANSIQSFYASDYEAAFLDLLFAFTDVAIPYSSFAVKGAVVSANVHNCNAIFKQIKDLI